MRVLAMVLIVLAVIVVLVGLAALIWGGLRSWRTRRAQRTDRRVAWTPYCTPVGTRLEIGVERRTEDDRELGKVHMHTVPAWIELEVLVAMNDAEQRARQYNEAKVGM
jgi:hypothetical protein